jgi:hypothetical protein
MTRRGTERDAPGRPSTVSASRIHAPASPVKGAAGIAAAAPGARPYPRRAPAPDSRHSGPAMRPFVCNDSALDAFDEAEVNSR